MADGVKYRLRQLRWILPDGKREVVGDETVEYRYADKYVASRVNVRVEPNTNLDPVTLLPVGYAVRVIDKEVDQKMLQVLGKPAVISNAYKWLYIAEGEHAGKFVAAKFLTDIAPAPQPSPSPSPVPPPGTINPPAPLNGLKGLTLQTVGGKTFLRGGQYMGVNLRECIYWGHPDIAPYMSQADWGRYFGWLAAENIKWARCYVFNMKASIEDTEARMQSMLDEALRHGIRICAEFVDSIGMELDTGGKHRFNLASHRPFHTGPLEHIVKDFYLRDVWRETFLPLVIRIVNKFKGHKALGMWQIMNEGAIYPQPATQADSEAFHRMIYTISKEIYERDKSTPIADGCISPHVHAPQGVDIRAYAKSYYNRNPYIHVATMHVYQDRQNPGGLGAGESYALIGMEAAQETGRATGYTEFGAKVNRFTWLRGLLDRAIVQGDASFLCQWALELDPPYNKGIGDNDWGWGNKNFDDFEALRGLYEEMGNRLRAR